MIILPNVENTAKNILDILGIQDENTREYKIRFSDYDNECPKVNQIHQPLVKFLFYAFYVSGLLNNGS